MNQYKEYPFPNDKPETMQDVKIHNWILRALPKPIKENAKIADVGCGTGEMSLFLSQYGNVTGFDCNENSLWIANENKDKLKRNIKYVYFDLTGEYNEEKYDYVFCIGVLMHLPRDKRDKAIENLKKMLKPKGTLIISVYNIYSWFGRNYIWRKIMPEKEETNMARKIDDDFPEYEDYYTQKDFRELLEKHNLKIIGQFRKIPDAIRLITGKNCMMTMACEVNHG